MLQYLCSPEYADSQSALPYGAANLPPMLSPAPFIPTGGAAAAAPVVVLIPAAVTPVDVIPVATVVLHLCPAAIAVIYGVIFAAPVAPAFPAVPVLCRGRAWYQGEECHSRSHG